MQQALHHLFDKFNGTFQSLKEEVAEGEDIDHRLYTASPPRHTRPNCISIFPIPASVNYVAKTIPGVPILHQDYAPLSLLARVLSSTFLHKEIREKGGAYGAGLSVGNTTMSFYSYRDPNVQQTYDVFDKSADFISGKDGIREEDVVEAKLSLFGDFDSPVSPFNKGSNLFELGISNHVVERQRTNLYQVQRDDMLRVGEKYLRPLKEECSLAWLGPEQEVGEAKELAEERVEIADQ